MSDFSDEDTGNNVKNAKSGSPVKKVSAKGNSKLGSKAPNSRSSMKVPPPIRKVGGAPIVGRT